MSTKTKAKAKLPPWGIVAELAGLLHGVEVDEKEGYAEYLAKKYS